MEENASEYLYEQTVEEVDDELKSNNFFEIPNEMLNYVE